MKLTKEERRAVRNAAQVIGYWHGQYVGWENHIYPPGKCKCDLGDDIRTLRALLRKDRTSE